MYFESLLAIWGRWSAIALRLESCVNFKKDGRAIVFLVIATPVPRCKRFFPFLPAILLVRGIVLISSVFNLL